VLEALLFGITLGFTIGPLSMLIMTTSAAHGLIPAIRVIAGLMVADFIFSTIAFGAGAVIEHFFTTQRVLFAHIASFVLVSFGCWMILRSWRSIRRQQAPPLTSFKTAFFLAISNPVSILMFVGFAGQLVLSYGWTSIVSMSLAVCIGAAGISLLLAACAASLRKFLTNPIYLGWLNGLSGCGIVAFGVYGFVTAC